VQFIADNAAAISARLKELESEKAKARGDDPKPVEAQSITISEPFHFYGTPVVNGGCYQAPDDYCGFDDKTSANCHPRFNNVTNFHGEVQWTPSGPYLPDAEPREIAKAMLKLCAPDDFMG
jgi:hypothetical protein